MNVMSWASVSRLGRRSGRKPTRLIGAGNVARPSGRESIVHKPTRRCDTRDRCDQTRDPEERQPKAERADCVKAGCDNALARNNVHRAKAGLGRESGVDCAHVDGGQIDGVDHVVRISRQDQRDRGAAAGAGSIVEDGQRRLVGAGEQRRSQVPETNARLAASIARPNSARPGLITAMPRWRMAIPATMAGRKSLIQMRTG